MTDQSSKSPKVTDTIPVPYTVIGAAWVVLLIGANTFYHQIDFWLWVSGPGLMLAKVFLDAEKIGKIKDNPPPKVYNFHAPGVWAQLDQTIKTLPGSFKNVSVHVNYQNLSPPKGMPMQLDATITLRHPDVDKTHVPSHKQNDMKSTLTMHALITPMGNQAQLLLQFKTDALISRKPLDEIITHIQQHVDALVSQFAK